MLFLFHRYVYDNDLYLFTREGRIKNNAIMTIVVSLFFIFEGNFPSCFILYLHGENPWNEQSQRRFSTKEKRQNVLVMKNRYSNDWKFFRRSWSSHMTIRIHHHPLDSSQKSGTQTSTKMETCAFRYCIHPLTIRKVANCLVSDGIQRKTSAPSYSPLSHCSMNQTRLAPQMLMPAWCIEDGVTQTVVITSIQT